MDDYKGWVGNGCKDIKNTVDLGSGLVNSCIEYQLINDKDVYLDALWDTLALISVLSKLKFLVMYWPSIAGWYTKNV